MPYALERTVAECGRAVLFACIPSAVAIPPHIANQCALAASPAMSAARREMVSECTGRPRACASRVARHSVIRCLILDEDLPSRRLQIVELSVADRPEERPEAEDHEHERQWDENEENAHDACCYRALQGLGPGAWGVGRRSSFRGCSQRRIRFARLHLHVL